MQVGLRRFSPPTVEGFKAAHAAGDRSRASLAREPGEREQGYDPMGRPCLGSARKVPGRLAADAGVALPAAAASPGDGHRHPAGAYPDTYPDTAAAAPLAALRGDRGDGPLEAGPPRSPREPRLTASFPWRPRGTLRAPPRPKA